VTWASIILAVLKLVNILMTSAQQNKWLTLGEERAIAAASAEVLRKVSVAQEVWDEVSKMDEKLVDDLLRSLEPVHDDVATRGR
jgi:hypothetical protein